MDRSDERQRSKLSQESIGATLIRAGCFLSAYELLKAEVVEKVHDFFLRGVADGHSTYDEASYRRDVLNRKPSKYSASCAWLVERQALTADQVVLLENVHAHRKEIAHELPKLLVDPDFEVRSDLLLAAVECLRALGVFWGSIAVDTDPAWDGKEVDYDDIKSGSFLLLEYLISVAGVGRSLPGSLHDPRSTESGLG
jgi:hypothetical protein